MAKLSKICGTTTHGRCYTAEYAAWKEMRRRCSEPKHKKYKSYGGRGIKVCDRWQNSFSNFFDDLGERPTDEHTLDRENNDLDYTPNNCRWATKREQQNNRRCNRVVTAFGRTAALATFFPTSKCRGYKNALYRIDAGWPAEKAITASPYGG